MVFVHFSFWRLSQDAIQYTLDMLVAKMSHHLSISPEKLCYVQCQHDAPCWFNVTYQVPHERELVNKLRNHAIGVEKWLLDCGVKAVRIGDEAQLLLQPITATFNLATAVSDAGEQLLLNILGFQNSVKRWVGNIKMVNRTLFLRHAFRVPYLLE